MISIPRAVAYIDLTALEENYKLVKSRLAPGVKILSVVKADAYGHGATDVARKLEAIGADYLGVATVDEGSELRQSGIGLPILIMSGLLPWDDVGTLFLNNLTPVVYDIETIERIKAHTGNQAPLNIHIKVDTGMGRLGFSADEALSIIDRVKDLTAINVEGLMSHFSQSEKIEEYGLDQVRAFERMLGIFSEQGRRPPIAHMANSGAILNYPQAHFDMVRVGIFLYGSHPAWVPGGGLPVRQVMKLVSKIALIREFPPGYFLSYGRTYSTGKPVTKVAYIPFGYGDGYPRALSNKGSVLIKEKKCGVVGRVCMDWLLVDVTHLDQVDVEEEVILLGQGNTDVITADEIADLADTIPYEILCRISKRIPRVYV